MPTHCKAGDPSLSIFNGHLHNSGRTARIAHRNSEPNRPNETCWVENLRLEVLNQELIRTDPHLWRLIGPRRWKSTFFSPAFLILSSLAFVRGATWYVGDIFLPCLPDRLGKYSERHVTDMGQGDFSPPVAITGRLLCLLLATKTRRSPSFFDIGGESLWNVGRGQNYHVTAFSLTLIFFTHFSAASQGTVCVKTSNPEPPPPHVCPIKHRSSIKHHFWCTHTAHRPDSFSAGCTPH